MTSLHARLCAVVTAASCLVHGGLAWAGHHGLWVSAAMTAMVAVCLPCTVHLWRAATGHLQTKVLHRIMASALAMAVLHALLALAVPLRGHAHDSTAALTWAGASSSRAMSLGIIAAELATALLAATLVSRIRADQRGARPVPAAPRDRCRYRPC